MRRPPALLSEALRQRISELCGGQRMADSDAFINRAQLEIELACAIISCQSLLRKSSRLENKLLAQVSRSHFEGALAHLMRAQRFISPAENSQLESLTGKRKAAQTASV